jgi:parvulin-like peptidyl-prolyl isomerase
MAKAKAKQAQVARRSRPAHHSDAERWNRLLIVGGVLAVIVLAVAVIAFGWYRTQIAPLGDTVLRVGETKFTLGHLERRMRLERGDNPLFGQPSQALLALPDTVMEQLEREGKLLEGADELKITVTDEEVTAEIRDRGGLAQDVESDLFAQEFRRQVKESSLHESEYRQMIRAELLEGKVRDYYRFIVPAEEPQVRGRYIILEEQERADEVLQRLRAAEDFGAVALEAAVGGTLGEQQQGELDWSPRGGSAFAPDEIEDFLFEAEPGQISDVMAVSDLFYIVQLQERADSRALTDEQKQRVAARELTAWLDGLTARLEIKKDFSDEDKNRALNDIF